MTRDSMAHLPLPGSAVCLQRHKFLWLLATCATPAKRLAAAMSLWALAGCATAPEPEIVKSPQQATAEFLPKVEAALSGLALNVESYRVRLRRCEGRRGEIREDVFHVWVLLHHARSHADDGAEIVDAARERWLAKGWKISYYNPRERRSQSRRPRCAGQCLQA